MRALFLPEAWSLLFVAALVVLAACGDGGDDPSMPPGSDPDFVDGEVGVIPRPAEVRVDAAGSRFVFTGATRILVEPGQPELEHAATFLHDLLAPHLPGLAAVRTHAGERAPRGSVLVTTRAVDPGLGAEGYELLVTHDAVTLWVNAGRGALHGVQTLRQLLPPEIEPASPVVEAVELPSVH